MNHGILEVPVLPGSNWGRSDILAFQSVRIFAGNRV